MIALEACSTWVIGWWLAATLAALGRIGVIAAALEDKVLLLTSAWLEGCRLLSNIEGWSLSIRVEYSDVWRR